MTQTAIILTTCNPTLDDLAAALAEANEIENAARARRAMLEGELSRLLGHTEAGNTFEGDDWIVETKTNYVRKVDEPGFHIAAQILGADLTNEIFPLRPVVDLEAYSRLKHTNPALYAIASRAVALDEKRPTVLVRKRGADQ